GERDLEPRHRVRARSIRAGQGARCPVAAGESPAASARMRGASAAFGASRDACAAHSPAASMRHGACTREAQQFPPRRRSKAKLTRGGVGRLADARRSRSIAPPRAGGRHGWRASRASVNRRGRRGGDPDLSRRCVRLERVREPGLMTGLAVAGYGAGALVMGPLAAFGMAIAGVPATFAALGLMYLAVIVLAGRFHVDPPQAIPALSRAAAVARGREYGVAEAVRTPRFWMLWTLLFVNVSAGIMVLSQVSPMAQEIAGLSPFAATGMIGLISLANAAGRVFWAWVSDAIGRAEVFALLFAIQAVTFVVLPALRDPALFGTALALVGLCFGGGF